jgi:hypothetical protein
MIPKQSKKTLVNKVDVNNNNKLKGLRVELRVLNIAK